MILLIGTKSSGSDHPFHNIFKKRRHYLRSSRSKIERKNVALAKQMPISRKITIEAIPNNRMYLILLVAFLSHYFLTFTITTTSHAMSTSSSSPLKRILVTGGNKGIGKGMCIVTRVSTFSTTIVYSFV